MFIIDFGWIYSLSDTHGFRAGELSIGGDLARKIGYSLIVNYTQYDCPKINEIVVNGNPYTVMLDDRYVTGNLSLQYRHDAKAQRAWTLLWTAMKGQLQIQRSAAGLNSMASSS